MRAAVAAPSSTGQKQIREDLHIEIENSFMQSTLLKCNTHSVFNFHVQVLRPVSGQSGSQLLPPGNLEHVQNLRCSAADWLSQNRNDFEEVLQNFVTET